MRIMTTNGTPAANGTIEANYDVHECYNCGTIFYANGMPSHGDDCPSKNEWSSHTRNGCLGFIYKPLARLRLVRDGMLFYKNRGTYFSPNLFRVWGPRPKYGSFNRNPAEQASKLRELRK